MKRYLATGCLALCLPFLVWAQERGRARDFGMAPGKYEYRLRDTDYLKEAITNTNKNYEGRFILFTNVDFELFNLLAGHAATAIFSSRLYTQSERKLTTIQSFLQLLKDKPKT